MARLARLDLGGSRFAANLDGSTFSLRSGRHIVVTGLRATPDLNGRAGAVHGYNEKTERFEVLLADEKQHGHERKWISIRYANLVENEDAENAGAARVRAVPVSLF